MSYFLENLIPETLRSLLEDAGGETVITEGGDVLEDSICSTSYIKFHFLLFVLAEISAKIQRNQLLLAVKDWLIADQ